MPELPEVETTLRGLAPLVVGERVNELVVRDGRLRWPVPPALARALRGKTISAMRRRGKYLILEAPSCNVLVHFGMSGSLRALDAAVAPAAHDHVDVVFASGRRLRYRDPRRFGAILFAGAAPERHWLLRELGPEPLGADFTGEYLRRCGRGRRVAIKNLLLDGTVVAGVGNIYAAEALFRAGVHPLRAAGRISASRYALLVDSIKRTLSEAIDVGGTTLRDFVGGSGEPGYFAQSLNVYGREGLPCPRCSTSITRKRLAQRSSFYCGRCQR